MILRAVMPLMVRLGRAELVQFMVCAGYLAVGGAAVWVTVGALQPQRTASIAAAVILAGAALAWWLSQRRWHLVRDIPTSRIASASQGYVELFGQARLLPGQPPLAFNGLPPCVWFEVVIREEPSLGSPRGNVWVKASDEVFALVDPTGCCAIDPDHCEVHGAHERQWQLDGTRYRARFLVEGDVLYALGELRTRRASESQGDLRADVADQLRHWKSNPRSMLNRFDANRDGTIDEHEYSRAVNEAERLVQARHRELMAHPELHLMGSPGPFYPYILSNVPPEDIAGRFRGWARFHALVAVLAGTGVVYLFSR